MLHRLRSVLVRPGRELLSGQVEVDETYLGGEEPGLAGGRAKPKLRALEGLILPLTCANGVRGVLRCSQRIRRVVIVMTVV